MICIVIYVFQIVGMAIQVVEFQTECMKLERFLPKNQHTQRKFSCLKFSQKNELESANFSPSILGQKNFVRFLGDLKKPKSPFVAFCSFFPCSLTFFHRRKKKKSGGRQQKSSRADKQDCFPEG